ncbi:restriction endonuclease subunit S [Alkaliphilus sp. B6464]|uniref:restriction endonuclease subunit S n=1 Tax=Alkaliphilus sp. B6464 TaxID=2731219 RepID=UPI001BA5FA24|nr:restriction endonuclease subunit S [Alkaliphilus sp. B6464]QUH18954.1 restriction endonuclease subunit S [Alkaliphilus sp. B6464]
MEVVRADIKEKIEKINRGEVPEGYKKMKDGIYPNDWNEFKLSKLLKIVLRPIELQDDKEYNLITVKRNFGGIQSRGTLHGEKILVKSQFEIHEGDFVISKRQIAHGACAIVPKEFEGSIVSNEYNVMNCKKDLLNVQFFKYYTQLPFMKRYFYITSDGVHIEKLLFKTNDWLKQKITIPYFTEQNKIANILSTWDKAIELKEELIQQKKEQKKGLMQNLLTGKVRLDDFDGEWEEFSFAECCKTIPVKKYQIKTSEYLKSGKYPVVDQGKSKIVAYSNDFEKVFKSLNTGIIVFGDHTREVKFIDFDFIVGADGTQIITNKSNFDIRFLYYQLLMKEIPNTGYNRHFKFVKEMKFAIPDLEEQNEIAKILSTVDKEIELHEKELENLQEQKKGLMNLLLTGKVRVEC